MNADLLPPAHPELAAHIDSIAIVDTHEHQCTEQEWLDSGPGDVLSNLFIHYIKSDLVAAGCNPEAYNRLLDGSDPDIEGRWNDVKDVWDRVQFTGYGEATRILAHDIFGMDEITPAALAAAQPKLDVVRQPGGRYRILKETGRLDHVQIDDFRMNCVPDPLAPEFFLHDMNWSGHCNGTIDAAAIEEHTGVRVTDLETLKKSMEQAFAATAPRAIAVKLAHAYERTILWRARDDAETDRVLQKRLSGEEVSADENLVVGDWCVDRVARLCAEHELPLKIHTGYLGGNWVMPVDRMRPGLLADLVITHPETRFVLMHMAWPYQGELLAMAKHFTNVYVDMCWAWTMSPRASHDFLREYLHAAPIHKLFGFGGDVYYPTGPAAYAIQARRWMSRALSAEIGDGDLTLQQAMDIATRVLRGNQYKLFDIESTRDACRQAALTPSRNSPAG